MVSHEKYFQDSEVVTIVEQITNLQRAEDEQTLLFIAEHSTVNLKELLAALTQH